MNRRVFYFWGGGFISRGGNFAGEVGQGGIVGVDDFVHFFDGGFQAAGAEEAGAGHEGIGSGAGTFGQ